MRYSVQELGGYYGIFRNGNLVIIVKNEKIANKIKNLLKEDERLDRENK